MASFVIPHKAVARKKNSFSAFPRAQNGGKNER
jgi:hypothetical protein